MGENDCHSGNWNVIEFDVFVVKDSNYSVIIMSTYSGIMVCDDKKEEYLLSKGQVLTFYYAEPFSCNYLYRGDLDNYNYMRHDGRTKHQVGLENVWITHR